MNTFADKLCSIVKHKPSKHSERWIIALRDIQAYNSCVKALQTAGIKPIKSSKSMQLICCHAARRVNWKQLRSSPYITYIERDLQVKAHKQTLRKGGKQVNSSRIPWNINSIKAPSLWLSSCFGAQVKVGIIDTGIAKHPELNIAGGVNTQGKKSYYDDNGHGTHVAGIVAAKGRKRIYGAAPRVQLYAIKVLDASGSGYVTDIVEGIDWCLAHGINIMNMSLGLTEDSKTLHAAICRALRMGAILVASAGNHGKQAVLIDAPARYSGMLAVAAVNRYNRPAAFSSRGKGISLAAPGVRILSTGLKGSYFTLSGTSMSTPHVTGTAALLRAKHPNLDASAIKARLQKAALQIPGGRNSIGHGLVQAVPSASKCNNKLKGVQKPNVHL